MIPTLNRGFLKLNKINKHSFSITNKKIHMIPIWEEEANREFLSDVMFEFLKRLNYAFKFL